MELEKLAQKFIEKFNLNLRFDKSINDIIYSEGVYPTQGVRPLFTTIHQILKSKLSMFLSEIFIQNIKVDNLFFSAKGKILTCFYYNKEKLVHQKDVEIVTNLEDVRQNKKNDIQAITAVHESGHAVLSAVLLKTIPEVIFSITSDSNSDGFVYSNFAWNYVSKKELIPRVATILGGFVAEELIFGKENITSGAESDIEKATEFLSRMYKRSGMGNIPITYSIPDDNDTHHEYKEVENEVKNAILEAKELAKITLKKEKKMLLALSDYLSDNRLLRKQKIKNIVDDTIAERVNFIENGDHLFYREHLKQLVNKENALPPKNAYTENAFSLNKGTELSL